MERTSPLDDLMKEWEAKLGAMGDERSTLDAFLDLSAYDMRKAAEHIDCPFCKRHMLLESGEISHVLSRMRSDGDRPHRHGFRERLETFLRSLEIVANVLLGGLRRAGII